MKSYGACSAGATEVYKAVSTHKATELTHEDVTRSELTDTHERCLLRLKRCGVHALATRANIRCRLCKRCARNGSAIVTSVPVWRRVGKEGVDDIVVCRPLLEASVRKGVDILGCNLHYLSDILARVCHNLILGECLELSNTCREATTVNSDILNLNPLLGARHAIAEAEIGVGTAISIEPDALCPSICAYELHLKVLLYDA